MGIDGWVILRKGKFLGVFSCLLNELGSPFLETVIRSAGVVSRKFFQFVMHAVPIFWLLAL